MGRLTRRVVAITLALAALLALSGSVGAAPGQQGAEARVALFGEVTALGAESFQVATRSGEEAEVRVTTETQFRAGRDAEVGFGSVAVGQRVAVVAQRDSNGDLVALQVLLVPEAPRRTHLTLTVVEQQGGVLIARDEQGNLVTIETSGSLPEDLVGKVVTVVAGREEGRERVKAEAAVAMEKVIERLEQHVQKAREKEREEAQKQEERARQEQEEQARRAAELKAKLEASMKRQLELLARTAERLPPDARARLEAAVQRHHEAFTQVLQALGEAREEARATLDIHAAAGLVKEVDAEEGVLVLVVEERGDLKLRVTAETTVEVNGEPATLGDLRRGDYAKVRFDLRSRTAVAIAASTRAEAKGLIKAVDGSSATLVLDVGHGDELRLTATSTTEVTINRQPASVEELRAGMTAQVVYDSRSLVAHRVAARAVVEVEGTLQSVDPATGEIVVETEEGATLTLKVTRHTRLEVNGLVGMLAHLGPGAEVEATFDARTHEVLELEVRLRQEQPLPPDILRAAVGGTIAGVNADRRAVTIRTEEGREVTLRVVVDTQVRVGDREGSFEELRVGARAKALYNTETHVALGISTEGPSSSASGSVRADVRGRLVKVDAESRTLAIQTESGATLELRLTPVTRVEVEGRLGTLADLRQGVPVTAVFERETRILLLLRIHLGDQVTIQPVSPEVRRLSGTVAEVGLLRGVFVVQGRTERVVLRVTDTTRIRVNGVAATLRALRAGMVVEVEATAEGVALRVEAQGEVDTVAPPETKTFHGTLEKLDAVSGAILIRRVEGLEEFRVSTTTRISVNGAVATLAHLRVGMEVEVVVGPEGGVLELRAKGDVEKPTPMPTPTPTPATVPVKGTLEAVGAEQGTISVGGLQLRVNSETRVLVNGSEATLGDLQPGMAVEVDVTSDGVAVRIRAEAPTASEDTSTTGDNASTAIAETKTYSGALKEVNTAGAILITTDGDAEDFKVTSDTVITINGVAASLRDLRAGMEVVVVATADGVALRIEAKASLTTLG